MSNERYEELSRRPLGTGSRLGAASRIPITGNFRGSTSAPQNAPDADTARTGEHSDMNFSIGMGSTLAIGEVGDHARAAEDAGFTHLTLVDTADHGRATCT